MVITKSTYDQLFVGKVNIFWRWTYLFQRKAFKNEDHHRKHGISTEKYIHNQSRKRGIKQTWKNDD